MSDIQETAHSAAVRSSTRSILIQFSLLFLIYIVK